MATTANLQWWMRRSVRCLGMPGLAGLLLGALAMAGVAGGVLPLQHEVAHIRHQLAQQPRQAAPSRPVATAEQTIAADLEIFRARFPGIVDLSDQLDTLFELAAAHGLVVDKAQYVLVEKAGGALRRFEVTLPVSGSYPQLRAMVLDVLQKLPATAVAEIVMEREKIADGRARANLRLVFFVRKGA